jgi:hypothetical protein
LIFNGGTKASRIRAAEPEPGAYHALKDALLPRLRWLSPRGCLLRKKPLIVHTREILLSRNVW